MYYIPLVITAIPATEEIHSGIKGGIVMDKKNTVGDQNIFANSPHNLQISAAYNTFKNTYIPEDGSLIDLINSEIGLLYKYILVSNELSSDDKELMSETLNSIAEQVKSNKTNRLMIEGSLNSINDIASKTSDIGENSQIIISNIISMFGWH
ncbi:MAG: hypothetical protein DKM50_11390 [Candidatus Margulisiibacteriota bacterium]|nr:MAG: hypothetical protein A2X43_12120 [Candidatus Margulisbacteria bacterium GWD2_39_127]OGI03202.1 MAG: hypothetical protein A2X42_11360 [Candidatus Margulisbacteria bacterium GWF2_38_17]OGI11226.1 MAG: hypothetical protein A2X41_03785 [Candidatus Margulisbacteria bacterium GWE2_39_32]PZM78559.1 MAG: hypothetical protein DKM50_11390 [Candidatus Margulisiibacteriota bacterium]HAR63874.1 hypothetical protein [Candidatus Margulisiibacteriota bacterium]